MHCSFVLYSETLDGTKEYEKINGKYIKLDKPIKLKMLGVYKHSFACTLNEALRDWKCLIQIFTTNYRFYHTVIQDKNQLEAGTKFNVFSFPFWYLYSLMNTKKFHKVKIFC